MKFSAAFSIDKVLQGIGQIKEALEAPAIQKGLLAAADLIKDAAIAEAPVKSGNLKAGMRSGELSDGGAYAASTAPHGHLIEFGTIERFHKSGKSVGLVKANPFFERAVARTRKTAGDIIISKIKQGGLIPRG